MKRIILILLLLPILSFSQSKKGLEGELKATKTQLDSMQVLYYQQQAQYQQRITSLEATIDKIKFLLDNNVKSTFGVQSNTIAGISDTSQIQNNAKKVLLGDGDGLTPRTGGKLYTGARGGQYYINKNGNKTYIRRKN